MVFNCIKKDLVKALTDVSKATGNSRSLPILEGVLIEAGDAGITLTCFDLEFGLTATISANVTEKGSVVVTAGGLLKLAKNMTGDTITMSVRAEEKPSFGDGEKPYILYLIELSDGYARFTIAGKEMDEFPHMPEIGEAKEVDIPQSTLRSMLSQTLYAVAKVDTRPIHTGILFDLSDGQLNLVSVDGYRLAARQEKVESDEQISFVAPNHCLSNLVKLLNAKDESNVKILASKNNVIFECGCYRVFSRLLDGEFMQYKESIPKPSGKYVILPVKDFTNALSRSIQLISNGRQSLSVPLRVVFGADKTSLAINAQNGKYFEEIACESNGMDQDVEMGFNARYMMDALKSLDCDKVRFEFSSVLAPLKLISADGGEGFIHLVLPVRLKDEQAA